MSYTIRVGKVWKDFETKKDLEKYLKYEKKKRWEIVKINNCGYLGVVNRKQPKQWCMICAATTDFPDDLFRLYEPLTNKFIDRNQLKTKHRDSCRFLSGREQKWGR